MTTESGGIAIHKLPMHIANQIAAGEVVQRPESVVKELVENAIDAGASHVTIIIANAGKKLVQVIDDGSGMADADAVLAFERHATSKLETIADLDHMVTFGFRGEALPSIAAIAQVELKTRRAEDDLATLLHISGGTVEEHTRTSAPAGTSIAVRNLFFNTPARRQFLKADSTEYRHIVDTVQRYILSYPDVRITFLSDTQTVYDALPGTLESRARYVFGDRVAQSLIEVRETTDLMTITGFVGRPNFAKKTRGDQFLFVNGRFILSRLLNHAVVSAYENMLGQGEYPLYALFLNIDPRQVDVNVHPSKLEVKFSNERGIYTILNAVVRQSLYRQDLSPSMRIPDAQAEDTAQARLRLLSPEESAAGAQPRYQSFDSLRREFGQERPAPEGRMDAAAVDDLFRSLGVATAPGPASENADEGTVLLPSERPISDSQFLWQLHNKYIFTPIKSGLMIIDQHVAHERVLYEKALAALEHAAPFSQQLLFPHAFRADPGDYSLLADILEELRKLGFIVAIEPPNFVTVEAVPQDVRVGTEERILEELLEQFKEYASTGLTDVRHAVAASYGCRAAIKAGDKLSAPEMHALIDQLFATSNPYVCPHGRPILIKLSLSELDYRFGRTS